MANERIDVGVVYALASSEAGRLYAARATGLYGSDDNGASWQLVPVADVANYVATAVATSGNTVFAGTHGAIMRSEDDGQSWSLIGLAKPAPLVTALALSPTFDAAGVAVAGTAEDGVFVTGDGGLTWVPWNYGLIDLDVHAVAISPNFSGDQTIFAATETGLYRSANGGRSWQRLVLSTGQAPWLALAFFDGTLLVGSENGDLLQSDDLGESWQAVDLGQWQGKAINQIVAMDAVYVLAEDALLRLGPDLTEATRVEAFLQQTPLAMLPRPGGVIVGFAEGDLMAFNL